MPKRLTPLVAVRFKRGLWANFSVSKTFSAKCEEVPSESSPLSTICGIGAQRHRGFRGNVRSGSFGIRCCFGRCRRLPPSSVCPKPCSAREAPGRLGSARIEEFDENSRSIQTRLAAHHRHGHHALHPPARYDPHRHRMDSRRRPALGGARVVVGLFRRPDLRADQNALFELARAFGSDRELRAGQSVAGSVADFLGICEAQGIARGAHFPGRSGIPQRSRIRGPGGRCAPSLAPEDKGVQLALAESVLSSGKRRSPSRAHRSASAKRFWSRYARTMGASTYAGTSPAPARSKASVASLCRFTHVRMTARS
jgi:hypothetical protein